MYTRNDILKAFVGADCKMVVWCNISLGNESGNEHKEKYSKTTINSSHQHNQMLISELFSDNTYQIFVRYCKKKNYKYISDLVDFDFNSLYQIQGLGVKK